MHSTPHTHPITIDSPRYHPTTNLHTTNIQASESWRNLLGLVFALVVADLFMGSLGIIMRFPSEWAIIVREYYAGTNAVGPYLCANFTCTSPMIYGPIALVTLVYWLTGKGFASCV